MKVLIFEGLDNVGKSTIAKMIADYYVQWYNVLFIHSRYPSSLCEDPFKYQYDEFTTKAKMVRSLLKYEEVEADHPLEEALVIMDRSWLDEYVYGQIYRKEKPDDIKNLIKDCFTLLKMQDIQVCIVHLKSDILLSIENDDSHSFTSTMEMDEKKSTVKNEQNLFNEIIEFCDYQGLCPHVDIYVTEDGEKTKFRNKQDIVDDVVKQLKFKDIEL